MESFHLPLLCLAPLTAALAAPVVGQTTICVSVNPAGVPGNGTNSLTQSISVVSADGRYVAFESDGTNLVAGDANGWKDVFVRDFQSGATSLVSVDTAGAQGNNVSYEPSISADGRYVAFRSVATNLVPGDTNAGYAGGADVFVRDRTNGTTERVSVSSAGAQANNPSYQPCISADGRYVVFTSQASNLVAGDTNGLSDVFVRDRTSGTTERVSVDSAGAQANSSSGSLGASISADGRYVTYMSSANNLVAGDTNGFLDVFVRDRTSGTTELVSVDSSGVQGNANSGWPDSRPSLSADGRYVAYASYASNLVAGDTNGVQDVFVRDRQSGTTERVSIDSAGAQGISLSHIPSISADGRWVAFTSYANNLVPGDTNVAYDVFVHDRQSGTIERVSVDSVGAQANNASGTNGASFSADGRYVAFESAASNLVAGDANGGSDVFLRDRGGCSATATSYCTAGTTTNGCVAAIAGAGTPSASASSGFTISVSGVEGQKQGLLFYGVNNSGFTPTPWGSSSYLCVKSPLQRTSAQNSGGTLGQCDGVLALDWNAFRAANPGALGAPFVAGQQVFAQGWFRDPASPKTTNLSNGLLFSLCP